MDISPTASAARTSGANETPNSTTEAAPASSTGGTRRSSETAAGWHSDRFIDRLDAQTRDRVSLSARAQKLDKIAADFFSGTIRSDQIPALTQRLFQDGLISGDEFRQLGGSAAQQQQVSAVTEASHFLNDYIQAQPAGEERQQALSLLAVIESMNAPLTADKRQQEQQALAYVSDYTETLKENGAPADIINGFENVAEVLETLDKVRNSEARTGAMSSYGDVSNAF